MDADMLRIHPLVKRDSQLHKEENNLGEIAPPEESRNLGMEATIAGLNKPCFPSWEKQFHRWLWRVAITEGVSRQLM